MSLSKLLGPNRSAILKTWVETVINTYPQETARFLNRQKDPFANPIGQTTQTSIASLLDLLLADAPQKDDARAALDPIIRIRAVQDFSPAQATRFVFDLKNIVRTALHVDRPSRSAHKIDPTILDDCLELEKRIDELGLLAFDIYMQCREKIYAIKANELRERTFKAFARAGLVKEPLEDADSPGRGMGK
jgi:hypothetical protein